MEQLKFSHLLGRKVLIYILLVSSILSVVATLIQLYSDYRYELDELQQEFQAIETSHLDSLALNLWDFQDKAVEQQLIGIQSLPFIAYVQLTTPQGNHYRAGVKLPQASKSQQFDIVYKGEVIGLLSIEADYQEIYDKLIVKTGVILLTQLVKTLIAAFAIVFIVFWLVTRHIYKIEAYASQFDTSKLEQPLALAKRGGQRDELDSLVDALNQMRELIKTELDLRVKSELELQEFNQQLESKIKLRTQELEDSLTQLKETQSNLVQSEKMVALGQLVAGIAHEINTPLGISVTANSVMLENYKKLSKSMAEQSLTKSQLSSFVKEQTTSAEMLQRNLNRSVELIKNFKAVAVNQSSDQLYKTNLCQLINEVLATVQTVFKAKKYQINLSVPEHFTLSTYPSAWTQILTNLLMNSHLHGFENKLTGRIDISVEVFEHSYKVVFQDDGCGIPEHILPQVFDPFVTTKRGRGGSGLGLNILFNIVFEKLGGKVEVSNLEQGCRFVIECPIDVEVKDTSKAKGQV